MVDLRPHVFCLSHELVGPSDGELPPAGQKGPPFWEEWRGVVPDEEIEFVRIMFEDFCGSWE